MVDRLPCPLDVVGEYNRTVAEMRLKKLKGNCYDNAVVETFFKTIKSELIWPVAWQTRNHTENAVARYIDGFYNPIRRHSTLGYQSPIQFEMAGRE